MIEYQTSSFSQDEIRQAAQIQIQELPQGFLSSLGEKPLALIFEHVATSQFGVMVIAKESSNNRVIGYVFGATDTGQLYKDFLIRRTFQAIRYFLPKLLSWDRITKAIETLFYPARKQQKRQDQEECKAELLDLAVVQDYHGKGIAQHLFGEFVEQLREKGVGCFDIPTTAGLDRAHRFYEKMGAIKVGSVIVHEDRPTYIYRYIIQTRKHG
ncbi:GNAT family N-acetyltransferase [Litorilinea aerophila]|uniref:GNAT family N-acetyltransferase n=1 Tax=Litorilinea aerophila TaxID=1204385 RepID=A0A540V979_9CHLR|nr:GNAT family N-acetyltransferase [Litorilinea aerophila]MCC9078803.1 GNAT family N-acetyltransferase [Litorilinea aerophila]